MKTTGMVKMSLCCLLAVMVTSCNEYKPPASHFGTGTHRCFYHDVRNGQFYKGVADEENDAIRAAKNACLNAPPKDLDHQYCEFAECVFK